MQPDSGTKSHAVTRGCGVFCGRLRITPKASNTEASEQTQGPAVAWFFWFASRTWAQFWAHFLKSCPYSARLRLPPHSPSSGWLLAVSAGQAANWAAQCHPEPRRWGSLRRYRPRLPPSLLTRPASPLRRPADNPAGQLAACRGYRRGCLNRRGSCTRRS